MGRVFISHSVRDQVYADKIKERLIENGHIVDNVSNGISAGDNITERLNDLLKAANIVVVLFSKDSISSKYVNYEYNFAHGYSYVRNNYNIVPVLIDDATIPISLQTKLYLKFDTKSVEKSVSTIVDEVNRTLGVQSATKDKKEEIAKKVESNIAEYLDEPLKDLKKKELGFLTKSYSLYFISFCFLIGAAAFAFYNYICVLPKNDDINQEISMIIITLIISSLFVAISKFCFTLGKSFMVESLRNSNRIHAIGFGRFYLKVNSDEVEWSEVKDAFQYWNIDSGSSFVNQNSKEYDPEIISKIAEIANIIKK